MRKFDSAALRYAPPPPAGTLLRPDLLVDWLDGPPPDEAEDGVGNPFWFLSNFATTPFEASIGGFPHRAFDTGEAAFQAAKATTQDDFDRIASLDNPHVAKSAGRSVALRPDWNQIKVGVMRDVLAAKFHPEHQPGNCDLLLNTGNAKIVECNTWYDEVWGVNLVSGVGQNLLGLLLMTRRAELRLGLSQGRSLAE